MGAEPQPIGDDERLTQYGTTTEPFRSAPRPAVEDAVSLLWGEFGPLEAAERVRRWALDDGTDAARYTTAGALRQSGFIVSHTPTKRNRVHVSVAYPGNWDADVRTLFDSCFSEVEVADPPRYNHEED